MIIRHILYQLLHDKYLKILVVLFLCFNAFFLVKDYQSRNVIEAPEQECYDEYKGEINQEKIKKLIDAYNFLEKSKNEGEIHTKGFPIKSYTGLVKGDYNIYSDMYNKYKYAYGYKDFAKKISGQHPEFDKRKIEQYYDCEDEEILLKYDIYTLFCVLLAIYIGCKLVVKDREGKMLTTITLSATGMFGVLFRKCIVGLICVLGILGIFVIENVAIALLMGDLDGINQPIYALENYQKCTFSGSVLSAVVLGVIGLACVCTFVCYTSMLFSLLMRSTIYSLLLSLILYAVDIFLYVNVDMIANPISQLAVGNSLLDRHLVFYDSLIYMLVNVVLIVFIALFGSRMNLSKEE